MITRRQAVIGAAAVSTLSVSRLASAYPDRPIKVVVPMAAGGGTDVVARIFALKMSESLGQATIIENKAGAGGQIAVEYVMNASKDGHTILFCSSTPLTLPYLRKTKFDLLRDFIPIGQIATGNFVLVTNKSLPFDSARAFLEDAKRHPNKYSYGSPGNGSLTHMALALLKSKTGIEMTHIPYKSSGEVAQALVANQLDCSMDVITIQKSLIESNSVKALATTGVERDPSFPNLPTIQELKIIPSGYSMSFWYGVLMPLGVSEESRAKVQAAFNRAMENNEVQIALKRLGLVSSTLRDNAFRQEMEKSATEWKRVISENNMSVQ